MKHFAILEPDNEDHPLIGVVSIADHSLKERSSFDNKLQALLESHFDAKVEYRLDRLAMNPHTNHLDISVEIERDDDEFFTERIRISQTNLC